MFAAGTTLGRYVIRGLLGEGGMGQVYRAWDPRLRRNVAVKVLKAASTDSGDGRPVQAILREARAAAALDHPNVVAVYDVEEVEGGAVAYIAMELVEGASLRAHVRAGDAPMKERLRWIVDVGRALEAAHARGLVHRDIKPENVIVRPDGVVKVLDFGIARRQRPELALSTTQSDEEATLPTDDTVKGTPAYMAPEQLRGGEVGAAADQFAWGLLAFELLSGELPWGGQGDALRHIAGVLTLDPPSLDARVTGLPPGVAAAVDRALAKDPCDRFPSMRDAMRAFEADGSREPPSEALASTIAPPAARSRAWLAWAAGVAAAATFAGILGAKAVRRPADDPAGRAARPAACASNAACSAAAGAASICVPARGCVALASEDCRVLADQEALESSETVWIGTLLPVAGEGPSSVGVTNERAIDLARRDFATMLGAYARGHSGTSARRFGVVACDDSRDASRAARHLAEDVRVPAILGFRSGAEVIDLTGSLLLSRDVLSVVTLTTSPLLAGIPHREGQPRMVLRTTYNSGDSAAAIAQLVPRALEPSAKPALRGRPMKVALVRSKATRLSAFSDVLFRSLSFNGKSALENGTDYRELVFDEDDESKTRSDLDSIAERLTLFEPQVIAYIGDDTVVQHVVEPLERKWRGREAPTWVSLGPFLPSVLQLIGRDELARRRFLTVNEVATRPENARFVMHYDEVFSDAPISRSNAPNASYDAFYLVAYATHALGDGAVTGPGVARAVERLLPPGRPVQVGVPDLFEGFSALRRGERIDLAGALGPLDFDLKTGDSPVDQAILCPGVDDRGFASDGVESGLVFRAARHALEGTLHCP